jgi:hypothetical protein
MSFKEHLTNLYNDKWVDFSEELKKADYITNFAMPFLLDIPDEINNKFRIMIYGQETWGWHDGKDIDSWIENGMNGYRRFFWDKNFYKEYGKSSFWQAFRFYEKNIPIILRESNVDIEPIFIWNNISKLGLGKGKTGVNDLSRELERQYFNVIREEFDIIKPHLVIFLTGPTRDHDIKFSFKESQFKRACDTFSQRKMALININGIEAVRLYHPAYFGGFNKKYKKESLEVIRKIINK